MALELHSYSELPAFRNKYPPGNRSTGKSELDDKWTRGYAVGIMQMTQGEPRTEKANWNDAEIEAMLDYLILHRSKLAGTTFKMSTFNEAAADIGTKNLRTHARPNGMWGLLLKRHGQTTLASSYNPAALAGPTIQNEPVPGSSTSGAGASTSTNLGDVGAGMADGMDTADNFPWRIPPLPRPIPVASTSVMGAPPISNSGNSGKHSHHDIVFDSAPPSVTSYMLMSETAMSGMP
ncbi:hypothetical protein BDR04DRAFT_1112361 [Suillus decipiens]|nr:hypothetical protein BDR04DRAFT_1112361 [Suillus decipiens]